MAKKLEDLIKRLKAAKELLNKDELDDKIKTKMVSEMTNRNLTGAKIADHYRDADETIPAKQRSNIKNALKVQEIKTAAAGKLKVAKKEEQGEVKKSALDIADSLIKSLQKASGAPLIKVQARPKQDTATKAAVVAEQQVMDMLAKKVGNMMPMNAKLQPTQAEFEAAMVAQGMAHTPEQLAKMDADWGSTMNGFYAEASRPISQRFKNDEEEEAYWAGIKISGGADNGPGY